MVPTLILLLSCAATATEPSPSAEAAEERPTAAVPAVDEERVRAAGIRKLVGQHLTLYTDLPAGADIDGLTADFDRAYTQWCEYFGQSPRRDPPWRVTACVIEDKQKFVRVGLMPKDLPPFLHAYFRGNRLWVYEQPSAYYRRHLLLHEGTHAFMNAHLGSCGPPWYKEGMAELLATHAIEDGHVSLNHFPADPEEVPDWGRIRLVRDALAAGRRLTMDEVLGYGSQRARRSRAVWLVLGGGRVPRRPPALPRALPPVASSCEGGRFRSGSSQAVCRRLAATGRGVAAFCRATGLRV